MPQQKAKNQAKQQKQPAAPPAIAAAIYLRVSTEEQAREGFGLDVQLHRCQAMATVKGWEVQPDHLYRDEGISGTLDETGRPGLASLMAAVEQGTVQAVIVLALDRIGRKTAIIMDVVDRITDAGAEVVSCKESLDTTTPAGRFVLTIFAGLAQLERDNILERTGGGRDTRGRHDGEKGGRVPYGYLRLRDAATGKATGVAIDRPAAAVVKQIFQLRKKKRATLEQIADALTVPSPRGGAWYAGTVKIILDNEDIYRGGERGASAVRWPSILNER